MKKWALISGFRRHFVDGVLAVQQIVSTRTDEQLSGSLCGKVGALQGYRPFRWNHLGFQYLVRADKWS